MKSLNKHILKYESALKLVQECLGQVNALSNELLPAINFAHGQFYTLETSLGLREPRWGKS